MWYSLAGVAAPAGALYSGDCYPGDRAATAAEIAAAQPPLAAQITVAIAACIHFANTITAEVTAAYPQSEIDSWPAQLAEARLVQAGQTPPAPSLLQALVSAQNNPAVTLSSLAASVIANATAYQNIVAAVQATRLQAQTQLNAVTDPAQIPGVLASLKSAAATQAQALGLTVPAT